jgi:hypothetical protein
MTGKATYSSHAAMGLQLTRTEVFWGVVRRTGTPWDTIRVAGKSLTPKAVYTCGGVLLIVPKPLDYVPYYVPCALNRLNAVPWVLDGPLVNISTQTRKFQRQHA